MTASRVATWALRPAVILPALVLAVYLRGVAGEFLYDDLICVLNNPPVDSISTAVATFGDPAAVDGRGLFKAAGFRPLVPLVHALVHAAFGFNPVAFHLLNDIFHAANAVLLYLLLMHLIRSEDPSSPAEGRSDRLRRTMWMRPDFLPAVFAAWWALHPVQVEAVEFISSAKDPLSGAAILLTVLLFLKNRQSWSLLAFLTALLLKESAAVTPAILVLAQLRRDGLSKRTLGKVAPFFLVLVVFLIVRTAAIGVAPPGKHWANSAGERLTTMAEAFFVYVRLLLFPVHLKANYLLDVATGVNGYVVFTVAVLIAAAVAFLAGFKKHFLVSFGLFWFFVFLFPVSNVIPIHTFLNERYLYHPAMGLALVGGAVVRGGGSPRSGKAAPLLIVAVALLAVLSVSRLKVWQTEEAFLRDITAKEPAIFGYRLAYGQVLMNHRKYAEAKVALASVHEQWPESLDVALALLRATRQADGDAAAEAFLSRLLRKHPSNTRVALELAKLQFDLKEYESSLDLFRGVLAAEPDNLDAQRGCEAAERQLAGD